MDTQHSRPCSAAAALGLAGDRWALLAVREVMFGNHRFSEIARNTATPRDRLAPRLKAFAAAGILERGNTSPARRGTTTTSPPRAGNWYLCCTRSVPGATSGPRHTPLRVEHHGHPVRTRVICATCGERVRGDDLEYISAVPDWDIPGLKRGAEQAVPAPEPTRGRT